MQEQESAPAYYIWGVDNSVYGPVELPTLVNWIKDERVVADTWIYVENDRTWSKAADITELKVVFRPKGAAAPAAPQDLSGFKPGCLRRVRILAEMTDDQLATFSRYIELVRVRPFTQVAHKGEPGDTLYGVLEGELRSCLLLDGKECPVANLTPGNIFGEISLLDKGPHAADVITNQESLLLSISAASFEKFIKEAPEAALPFLLGLVRSVAGRVRTLTRRYEDSMHIVQKVEVGQAPGPSSAPLPFIQIEREEQTPLLR